MAEGIFVAVGDSFTWGQGLYYYDLIKNSKLSAKEIKDFLLSDLKGSHYQWVNIRHKITNRDLESIKSLRYIDLISKELDMDYITKEANGGSNHNNINLIGNTLLLQVDVDPNHPGYRAWGPRPPTLCLATTILPWKLEFHATFNVLFMLFNNCMSLSGSCLVIYV